MPRFAVFVLVRFWKELSCQVLCSSFLFVCSDVLNFDWVEPPSQTKLKEAVRLLQYLGGLDAREELTPTGTLIVLLIETQCVI